MHRRGREVWDNPLGTDGFEFVEYTAADPSLLRKQFELMGFVAVARHRRKNVTLYRQGDINFLLNAEPCCFAQRFAQEHGPSICALAFRVHDAAYAFAKAVEAGAEPVAGSAGPMELQIPAIRGVGGSIIYLVDRYGKNSIYDVDFVGDEVPESVFPQGVGLATIDHLTHNVHRGNMDSWASFYARVFNFREVRFFAIDGQLTGLKSRAMASPCGKIRIPINESADEKSQIVEYLNAYHGEGIQHVALATSDIYQSVQALRRQGVRFLSTPKTYYDAVDERLPGHGEDVDRLREEHILIDGTVQPERRLLLQIFTENMVGPIFFEIIQRRGDEGFGEGNFQALFDAIERDQLARGVLVA